MYSIIAERVSKNFGQKEVLKDISFTVSRGEIFGLLGPSGAGKTTLIKLLTGQLSYKGEASLMGKSCNKPDKALYAGIGMVMDNCGLYDRLSCQDNLMLFARLHNRSKEEIDRMLSLVGLKGSKAPAGKLSKGMRQRLAIARALLHKPRLLFLDEPASGLDPAAAAQLYKLLLEVKNEGTTIFLTTHNMEEAHKLCDHIALLHEGRIVEYGTPDELCRKYNTENRITLLLKDGKTVVLNNEPAAAKSIAAYIEENRVETIHSSEPNLETVFMALTGKELNQ